MKLKVEISDEMADAIVIKHLHYWADLFKRQPGTHKDDKKEEKKIIEACKVLLAFYEGDE